MTPVSRFYLRYIGSYSTLTSFFIAAIALQAQRLGPLVHIAFIRTGSEALAVLPITRTGSFGKQRGALPQPRRGRSAERDHLLTAEIIVACKMVSRPCGYRPSHSTINHCKLRNVT